MPQTLGRRDRPAGTSCFVFMAARDADDLESVVRSVNGVIVASAQTKMDQSKASVLFSKAQEDASKFQRGAVVGLPR